MLALWLLGWLAASVTLLGSCDRYPNWLPISMPTLLIVAATRATTRLDTWALVADPIESKHRLHNLGSGSAGQ